MASSPRINTQLGARQTLELRRKARLPVHRPSACSGVKALRNTSDARRQAAKLCYRFGPLTPSARSGNLIAGDGTKNGLSRSEQKTVSTTQNNRLTGKAPYKSTANLTTDDVTGPHSSVSTAGCTAVSFSNIYGHCSVPRSERPCFVKMSSATHAGDAVVGDSLYNLVNLSSPVRFHALV